MSPWQPPALQSRDVTLLAQPGAAFAGGSWVVLEGGAPRRGPRGWFRPDPVDGFVLLFGSQRKDGSWAPPRHRPAFPPPQQVWVPESEPVGPRAGRCARR